MIRVFLITILVTALTACGEEPRPSTPTPPVPVEMSGEWTGEVSVFSVGPDGTKTEVVSYPSSAIVVQNGNWATVSGVCPSGSEPMTAERSFINSSSLYWEGTEWCVTSAAGLKHVVITHIHLDPQPNNSVTGYAEGALFFADERPSQKMWASIRFGLASRGTPVIGRWEGKVVTKMSGAPDDVRDSTVIVSRRSDGLLVEGICPRGDASVLLTEGQTWGEVLCASPWDAGEAKTLVFESGGVTVDGDTATITMTGLLAEPGGTISPVVSVFSGARK
jgi:hypothetical protein